MAIDLSAYVAPFACVRGTLHATAGLLDVVTLPAWCKVLTIKAAGAGSVIVSHTGAQNAAVGATTRFTIANGGALTVHIQHPATYPLRMTGSVNADPFEVILEGNKSS